MSDVSRREAVRALAMAILGAGVVDRLAAQDAHHLVEQAMAAGGGAYTPTTLSAHEFQTLERLTELIIPAENGGPGAIQAGVAAWIDMVAGTNDRLKKIYVDGLAWMDTAMKTRGADDFLRATPEQQTALLDVIAFKKNASPELQPGIDFFIWARRMTVDGFYTSRVGMREIYLGNSPQFTFTVPQEAIDYALKRSGL
jgi:gluconate 2-dehydrogenase subunit 3-like protein